MGRQHTSHGGFGPLGAGNEGKEGAGEKWEEGTRSLAFLRRVSGVLRARINHLNAQEKGENPKSIPALHGPSPVPHPRAGSRHVPLPHG